MYRVTVSGSFSASHCVRLADGGYEPSHRHQWRVRACFAGPELGATGLLVDFVEARRALDRVLVQLHQSDLNENPWLAEASPSAEHVARAIHKALAQEAERGDLLESIEVEETRGCWAAFFPRGEAAASSPAPPVDDENGDS